jgi:hypothetical protein
MHSLIHQKQRLWPQFTAIGPISVLLWPLHRGNSSVLVDPSSQLTELSVVPHPRCTTWYTIDIHSLIHQKEALWPQFMAIGPISVLLWPLVPYQFCYGHYTGNSNILVDPSSQLTEPPTVFHTRCTTWYKIDIHSLIHQKQGLWPQFMGIGPISVLLWPLHRGNSSVLVDPSSQLTEPPTVSHPICTNWYTIDIHSLIHQKQALWSQFMTIGPISV